MEKYSIQCYNREMTTLLWEEEKDFNNGEEAVVEAFNKSSANAIIVLMEQSVINPYCWLLIAKFY